MKVLVLGGNGFVGRQMCREAISRHHQVYSLSRSGQPHVDDPILREVTWVKGDATISSQYPDADFDVIVHCIGRLWESKEGGTFQSASYRTTMAMLDYVRKATKPVRIGYVSADDFSGLAKWVMPGYFEWKRRAEDALQAGEVDYACVYRPGLIYGWDRPASVIFAYAYNLIYWVSGGLFPPAVPVERLAKSMMDRLSTAHDQKYELVLAKNII